MSAETRKDGRRFFLLNNWTAVCAAVLTTIGLVGVMAGIGWTAWGRDKVDSRIETKLFPIDARLAILETYIPQIEEELLRNGADHWTIMTQAQRAKAEQTYQDMRRGRIHREK